MKTAELCHYCRLVVATTSDHIVPRSKGGVDAKWNRVPACAPCNVAKGNSDPTCSCRTCVAAINMPRTQPRSYGPSKGRTAKRRLQRKRSSVDLLEPDSLYPRRALGEVAP